MRSIVKQILIAYCLTEAYKLTVKQVPNVVMPDENSEDFDVMTDIAMGWLKDAFKIW